LYVSIWIKSREGQQKTEVQASLIILKYNKMKQNKATSLSNTKSNFLCVASVSSIWATSGQHEYQNIGYDLIKSDKIY
jgi:hypothetical protein